MAGVALRVKILPRFLGRALMRGVLIPAVPAGAGEQPLVAGGIVRALVGLPCTGSQGMGGVFILAVSQAEQVLVLRCCVAESLCQLP